jgi:hypothetical protein
MVNERLNRIKRKNLSINIITLFCAELGEREFGSNNKYLKGSADNLTVETVYSSGRQEDMAMAFQDLVEQIEEAIDNDVRIFIYDAQFLSYDPKNSGELDD